MAVAIVFGGQGGSRTHSVIINLWSILSALRFNQFRHLPSDY
jgi:hypothetical protein